MQSELKLIELSAELRLNLLNPTHLSKADLITDSFGILFLKESVFQRFTSGPTVISNPPLVNTEIK